MIGAAAGGRQRGASPRASRGGSAVNLAIRDALVRVQGSALVHDVRVDPRAGTVAWQGRPRDASRFAWQPPVSGAVYGDAAQRPRRAGGAGRGRAAQPPYKAPPKAPVLYVKPRNTRSRARLRRSSFRDGVPALAMGACARRRDRPHRVPRARRRCARRSSPGYTVGQRRQRPARQLLPPDGPLPRAATGSARSGRGSSRAGTWRIPDALGLRVEIDGVERQRANTGDLRAHRRAAAGRRHRVHDARAGRRAADRRARGRAARARGPARRASTIDGVRHAGEHARRGGHGRERRATQ